MSLTLTVTLGLPVYSMFHAALYLQFTRSYLTTELKFVINIAACMHLLSDRTFADVCSVRQYELKMLMELKA